jgi:hypothetical protein
MLDKWNIGNFAQVQLLLRDKNLDWSTDFDSIRLMLADVFDEHALRSEYSFGTLNYLAEKLLEDENYLTA